MLTILANPCSATYEVKKSVFVGFAEPLSSPSDVRYLLKKHHDSDARHHCWAWRFDGEYRFSDDGEPAGTAGRPILQALEGAGLERTLMIVRRYFGGIKLGAGGLVRAYSTATSVSLQEASVKTLVPQVELRVRAPFEHTQALFLILAQYHSGEPIHTSAGIEVQAQVPVDDADSIQDQLHNQTHGQVSIQVGEPSLG